jgi:UDP-galactopyranose mutase
MFGYHDDVDPAEAARICSNPCQRKVRVKTEFMVVGAGFAGSTMARCLAGAGFSATLIDKRPHIGGNAYDELDQYGIRVHRYGPHIFHTNSRRVFEYLSQFTEWRPYEHRVLAQVEGKLLPIPINLDTLNRLYGLDLNEDGARRFLESVRESRNPIRTSEDVVVSNVGRDLCDKFFRGYTRKQWGLDLSELNAAVAARIPVRTNRDDRYFTDEFQAMPRDGYTRMFQRMLDHPNIKVELGVNFSEIKQDMGGSKLIYTGPIDEYFDYCYGKLEYRSLHFEHLHFPATAQYQPVGTVNYPNEHSFTRITEFKHLTGQQHSGTSIVREYPQAVGDPYYPVPRPENEALFKKYQELAERHKDVTFVGRLAQYRYYNMDQAVAASLKAAEQILAPAAPLAARAGGTS